MFRFLLFSLLSCLTFSGIAQCPAGDITLTSQAEIDAFATTNPGCTITNGSITIEEAVAGSITDLSGLSAINTVNGNLSILNSTGLTSLAGLNISTVTGALEIIGVSQLSDLAGLASLTSAGNIVINFNTNLTSLNGLQGITTTNSLDVISNGNLINLTGLDNLDTVNGLVRINSNFVLQDLSGLGSLMTINGSIQILSNSQLTTISGMSALTYIDGQLQISNNPLLTSVGIPLLNEVNGQLNITNNASLMSMSGLEALMVIGGAQLEISGNSNLTTLDGLDNFVITNGALNVDGNSNLADCETAAVCNYLDAPTGLVLISVNAPGCNSQAEVETACSPAPVELIRFAAYTADDKVNLTWETASEFNNNGFKILHGTNGRDFSEIGFQQGKGNTSSNINYKFVHDTPTNGKNYYQLIQEDFDGTTSYSSIIFINIEDDNLQIYPNPTEDRINFAGTLSNNYEVVISDLTGEVKFSNKNHSGNSVSLEALASGFYFVQIIDGGSQKTFSVVKQ